MLYMLALELNINCMQTNGASWDVGQEKFVGNSTSLGAAAILEGALNVLQNSTNCSTLQAVQTLRLIAYDRPW